MNVVIEVKTGVSTGHRRFLRANETLEVGRSGLLDFAFESDSQMSGRHFRIVTTRDTCEIEDLDSSNGTQVNGESIQRVPLCSEDTILAGETEFTVHVEGAKSIGTNRSDPPLAAPVHARVEASCQQSACKSGVNRYCGSTEQLDPAALARRLMQQFQSVFVVNVPQLNLEPEQREQLGQHDFLLEWLPEETRAAGSPWLITSDGSGAPKNLIETAWGIDGFIGVFSEPDEALPIAQLQRCAGAFVRPSVLRPQLEDTPTEIADDLMLEVEVILVEDESPDSWLLYSKRDLEPMFEALGLHLIRDESCTTNVES